MVHIVRVRAPAALAILLLRAFVLPAQDAPRRPSLGVDADTNSAHEYYAYGMANLAMYPERAAAGFYWASQLDPTWAQPLDGRRVALLLESANTFFIGYMNGERSFTHTHDAMRIDSLELHARMLDPFFERDFDQDLVMRYLEAYYDFVNATSTETDRQTFHYFAEQYLRTTASPYLRAALAVRDGRSKLALRLYRDALSQGRHAGAEIHMARSQVFHSLGKDDSARVEMQLGLDSLSTLDARDIVHCYESQGVFHHSIGLTWERAGLIEQARAAYARALQVDPRYYPAHLRLGLLAQADGDTSTALRELELAAQIQEDEPVVQTTYGAVLADLGHLEDADRHLRRAAELAPYYAAPYYALGRVAQQAHRPADAVQHYRAYLARAAAREARVAEVRRRLVDLQATAGPQ